MKTSPGKHSVTTTVEAVLGALLGIGFVGLVLFWDLPETYQSVNLPSTPLPLRIAVTAGILFLVAVALGWWRPATGGKWGLWIALPSLVVFGIAMLISREPGGLLLGLGVMSATLLVGWGGGHAGAVWRRTRRQGEPLPPQR